MEIDESVCYYLENDDSISELQDQLNGESVDQLQEIESGSFDTGDLENKEAEENDISRKGFERALRMAHDAVEHAKNVKEIFGYLGRRGENSFSMSWEKTFLDLHVVDKELMTQILDLSRDIKIKRDEKFRIRDFD